MSSIRAVLNMLILIFVVLLGYFFLPFDNGALFPLIAVFGLSFLVLGIVLLYKIHGSNIKGRKRKFLILTGVCAICPFLFSILHNVFYALEMVSEGIVVLPVLMSFFSVVSFILALLIAPVGFLVGAIMSIYYGRIK